jgi:hypothetical protein
MYLRIGGSAVDEGMLLPNPSVRGRFRCRRGLGADEEFASATDGSTFTTSQEVQSIAIDRPGIRWLVFDPVRAYQSPGFRRRRAAAAPRAG